MTDNDPRKFIRSRARRLVQLIELHAPSHIIEGEFMLLEQAMDAFRVKEGDHRKEIDERWQKYPGSNHDGNP